jgi:hypothetical protein
VVYFKVQKNREVVQCDPPSERVRKIVAKPAPEPAPESDEDSGVRAEFNAFLGLLHKKSAPWVKGEIQKLQDVEEVDAALKAEYVHPRYKGGRTGIVDALQERRGEITEPKRDKGPGDLEPNQPVHTVASGLPCPHCGFSAGSQEGLDSHIETHHANETEDL